MENHHFVAGKIHYFYGHFQLQTVSSPEGIISLIYPLVNIQKAIEHGPFIVSFPQKTGDFP